MINIDGIEYRTAAQWEKKHRHVLKGQLKKGVERSWRSPNGNETMMFYNIEQTRTWVKKDVEAVNRRRRADAKAKREAEERERLRRLVVERLSALHGLGAVGDRLHELGYLLVFLGELGILDGKLVDERGERGGICRIGLFCRISGVFLGGIRAYCSFNDFGCRLSFGFGNISYSICGFLLDSICSRNL